MFTAVALIALALFALILFCFIRKHRNKQHDSENGSKSPLSFIEGKIFKGNSGDNSIKRDQSNATTLAGLGGDEKGRFDSTIVPITVDQRLDPGQMFMRWDQNDSRRSLQDENDYSRKVLRVANPD